MASELPHPPDHNSLDAPEWRAAVSEWAARLSGEIERQLHALQPRVLQEVSIVGGVSSSQAHGARGIPTTVLVEPLEGDMGTISLDYNTQYVTVTNNGASPVRLRLVVFG